MKEEQTNDCDLAGHRLGPHVTHFTRGARDPLEVTQGSPGRQIGRRVAGTNAVLACRGRLGDDCVGKLKSQIDKRAGWHDKTQGSHEAYHPPAHARSVAGA